MRTRQRDQVPVHIRPRIPQQDSEGKTYATYGLPVLCHASIQPLSGQVAAQEYGEKKAYMLHMGVDSLPAVTEKDGICVYVDKNADPDYEVTAIKRWNPPVLELSKRGV